MKNSELFQKLVTRARRETHPEVNVAENVLELLSIGQSAPLVVSYKPLAWVASLSSAAAACVLFATYFVWQNPAADAMTDLYQMISWVAQ